MGASSSLQHKQASVKTFSWTKFHQKLFSIRSRIPTTMRVLSLCLIATASAFIAPHSPSFVKVRAAQLHASSNPFEEVVKGIRSIVSELVPSASTHTPEEIDEYCRDFDSTGCDVEMMEQMLKDARRTEIEQGRTAKREKVMYSQAIDEAVKENTPAW